MNENTNTSAVETPSVPVTSTPAATPTKSEKYTKFPKDLDVVINDKLTVKIVPKKLQKGSSVAPHCANDWTLETFNGLFETRLLSFLVNNLNLELRKLWIEADDNYVAESDKLTGFTSAFKALIRNEDAPKILSTIDIQTMIRAAKKNAEKETDATKKAVILAEIEALKVEYKIARDREDAKAMEDGLL